MKISVITQCAKDCDPHKHAFIYKCVRLHWFLHSSRYILAFVAYFLLISTVEELTQPTKHANKILVPIFLTMKAAIFDTHDSTSVMSTLTARTLTTKKY
jgi:hypothetical protein